jgi:TetR/AcrR family transcriptional regulator
MVNIRRARNKAKTKDEILAAAESLFARQGFSGTSFSDIESASGVSKPLILHHFGSKEGLYAALREKLNAEYSEELSLPKDTAQDIRVFVESTIRASYEFTKANDAFRRLGLWAYLEGIDEAGEGERLFTENLVAGVRAGQAAGAIRKDLDPLVMPFIVKGAIDFWIRKGALIRAIGGAEGGEALVRTLSALFLAPLPKEE